MAKETRREKAQKPAPQTMVQRAREVYNEMAEEMRTAAAQETSQKQRPANKKK